MLPLFRLLLRVANHRTWRRPRFSCTFEGGASDETKTDEPVMASLKRDDFPIPIKELLGKRVGYRCSNPSCRQPTSGPQADPEAVVNVGVAARITAAAQGGERYDHSL